MPWSGTASARVGHEVGGREAERAAALVAVLRRSRASRTARRAAARPSATAPVGDQRRGCASRRRSRRRPRPSPPRASRTRPGRCSSVGVAAARGGRSGSSRRPTRSVAPSRATSSWSMKSCAGLRHPLAVERDHDQLLDAERGDQVGLLVERRQQLRGRLAARPPCAGAARTSARCRRRGSPRGGRRARRRTRPRPGGAGAASHRGARSIVHQPRKPTTGLRVESPRGSASAIRPSSSRRRTNPSASPGTATPWAARRASSPVELDRGQERRARRRAPRTAPSRRRRRTRRSRVRRSSTQYASPRSAISERT